jgi:formamidopyrimidine-DNA glycosylase
LLGELIGKLLYYRKENELPKSYHVLFEFDDNSSLTFQSSLYGFLEIADHQQIRTHKYAGNIGISPDDKNFTWLYFTDVLSKNKKRPIKGLLGLQSDISELWTRRA